MSYALRASAKGRFMSVALALFAGFTPASRADITHRYNFNDGTANDSIGGANGTLVNGASVNGGELVLANNGYNGNPATGQYVALPANILLARDFTLETWFTFNGGNPWQRLLDLGNSYGGIGQGFIILTLNGAHMPLGQISINSWGDPADTDYVVGNTFFPVGGDHCLVYVHNTDAHLEQLYLNGVNIGTVYADVDPSTANYANFWIGRSQFLADPFYNGSIDELRTYNNALTPGQVVASFQAGPNVLVPEPAPFSILAVAFSFLLRRKIFADRHSPRRPGRAVRGVIPKGRTVG
jgi:arabinan endo-1,5-alpha-L-arabinosidase